MSNRFSSGVYQIQNTVSGRTYIGSSVRIARRLSQHKTALRKGIHQNRHLQNAWNKYGEAAFVCKTLLICAVSHLRFYEQCLIDGLRPDYNASLSAFSGVPIGTKLTHLHKAKVGAASKAHWKSDEYRAKVVAAINASMTPEERTLRSERTAKLWANDEYRDRAVAARKGNLYAKGYKCTPEQIENRRRSGRIANLKRYYGADWQVEYARRYPEHVGDLDVK